METRSTTSEKCWLIGNTLDLLSGNKLPSNGQVLRRMYHLTKHEGKSIKESASLTSQELSLFWEKARIPTRRMDKVTEKLISLQDAYKYLQKSAHKPNPKSLENATRFENSLDDLFDIAHANAMHMMLIQEDKVFLECQRKKGRQGHMAGVDKELSALEQRREQRQAIEEKRISHANSQIREVVQLASSSSSSEERSRSASPRKPYEQNFKAKSLEPSTSGGRRKGVVDIITPSISSALDRTGTSSRKGAIMLSAFVGSLGLPVDDFKISVNTIRRRRRSNMQKLVDDIKKSFRSEDPLTIHWDTKLLPSLTGTETVDRLAIYISGGGSSKLLAIPTIPDGTGSAQATAILQTLSDWGLTDDES